MAHEQVVLMFSNLAIFGLVGGEGNMQKAK